MYSSGSQSLRTPVPPARLPRVPGAMMRAQRKPVAHAPPVQQTAGMEAAMMTAYALPAPPAHTASRGKGSRRAQAPLQGATLAPMHTRARPDQSSPPRSTAAATASSPLAAPAPVPSPLWPRASDASRHSLLSFLSSPSCQLFPPSLEVRTVGSLLDQMIGLGGWGLDERGAPPVPGRPMPPITPQNEAHRVNVLIQVLQEMSEERRVDPQQQQQSHPPPSSPPYFTSMLELVDALDARAALTRSLGCLYPAASQYPERRMFRLVLQYLSSDACALFAQATLPVQPDRDAIETLVAVGGVGALHGGSSSERSDSGGHGDTDSPSSCALTTLRTLDARGAHFDGWGALIDAVAAEREYRENGRGHTQQQQQQQQQDDNAMKAQQQSRRQEESQIPTLTGESTSATSVAPLIVADTAAGADAAPSRPSSPPFEVVTASTHDGAEEEQEEEEKEKAAAPPQAAYQADRDAAHSGDVVALASVEESAAHPSNEPTHPPPLIAAVAVPLHLSLMHQSLMVVPGSASASVSASSASPSKTASPVVVVDEGREKGERGGGGGGVSVGGGGSSGLGRMASIGATVTRHVSMSHGRAPMFPEQEEEKQLMYMQMQQQQQQQQQHQEAQATTSDVTGATAVEPSPAAPTPLVDGEPTMMPPPTAGRPPPPSSSSSTHLSVTSPADGSSSSSSSGSRRRMKSANPHMRRKSQRSVASTESIFLPGTRRLGMRVQTTDREWEAILDAATGVLPQPPPPPPPAPSAGGVRRASVSTFSVLRAGTFYSATERLKAIEAEIAEEEEAAERERAEREMRQTQSLEEEEEEGEGEGEGDFAAATTQPTADEVAGVQVGDASTESSSERNAPTSFTLSITAPSAAISSTVMPVKEEDAAVATSVDDVFGAASIVSSPPLLPATTAAVAIVPAPGAPADPSATLWLYLDDEQLEQGPFPTDELAAWIASGALPKHLLVMTVSEAQQREQAVAAAATTTTTEGAASRQRTWTPITSRPELACFIPSLHTSSPDSEDMQEEGGEYALPSVRSLSVSTDAAPTMLRSSTLPSPSSAAATSGVIAAPLPPPVHPRMGIARTASVSMLRPSASSAHHSVLLRGDGLVSSRLEEAARELAHLESHYGESKFAQSSLIKFKVPPSLVSATNAAAERIGRERALSSATSSPALKASAGSPPSSTFLLTASSTASPPLGPASPRGAVRAVHTPLLLSSSPSAPSLLPDGQASSLSASATAALAPAAPPSSSSVSLGPSARQDSVLYRRGLELEDDPDSLLTPAQIAARDAAEEAREEEEKQKQARKDGRKGTEEDVHGVGGGGVSVTTHASVAPDAPVAPLTPAPPPTVSAELSFFASSPSALDVQLPLEPLRDELDVDAVDDDLPSLDNLDDDF